ncbi:sulfotransferase [Methylocucumis oryzae]|uniref:sulfotransferase n=1 Tax=Methylocucumis oryzae TaxID=1632867 RepID=UPI0010389430|nr:sulfotransferase [Methylocucumis oryzae]
MSASKAETYNLLRAVLNDKYKNESVVVDKNRGWARPGVIETMAQVLGHQPKIIATVRPVADCVASFVRLVKPDNVSELVKTSPLIEHLKFSYQSLNAGFAAYPNCFLFVEYDKLVSNPAIELQRIYDFLELPTFTHAFDAIESTVIEDDEAAWGIKDLHTIRPTVKKIAPPAIDVLGEKLHDYFDVPECWNLNKPVKPRVKLLDDALALALNGDFVNAESVLDIALQLDPNDNRALFNKGWYELARGNLKKGMQLIACGRHEKRVRESTAVRYAYVVWTGFNR